MRAAGWGVRVLPEEDGSQEATPPTLPEFLARDNRWQRGNLQDRHLLAMPGLRPLGRWQLLQAILMFAVAPLHMLLLAGCAALIAWEGGSVAIAPAIAFGALWLAAIHAPKLLGYMEVALSPSERARYGGGWRLTAGAAAEFAFGLMLDPLCAFHRTLCMGRQPPRGSAAWLPQNWEERGVPWGEAARLFWPHTLFGAALFAACICGSCPAVLWALPFAGGLLMAVPLAVLSADPRLGRWMRRRRLCAVPEEIGRTCSVTTAKFNFGRNRYQAGRPV